MFVFSFVGVVDTKAGGPGVATAGGVFVLQKGINGVLPHKTMVALMLWTMGT